MQEEKKDPIVRCAHTRLVNPQELKLHPLNPNKHPASQLKLICKVVELVGWRKSITVSKRSGLVTAGNGRVMAALSKGWSLIPVDDQEYDTEADEIADMLADNHVPELAQLDKAQVKMLLETKILPATKSLENPFNSDKTSYLKSELDKMFEAMKPQENPDYPIAARMNEKYDYVVIFTETEQDFLYLQQLCGVKKVQSYKNQYVGQGRAVPFAEFIAAVKVGLIK